MSYIQFHHHIIPNQRLVVDELVNGTAGQAGDSTSGSLASNVLAKAVSRLAKAEEVGSKTDNVGSGHGGTRDGVDTTVGPVRLDVSSGSEDIDAGAVVGVVGEGVIDVGSTNSASGLLGSGGGGGGIGALVTGGNTQEGAGGDNVGSGSVDSSGGTTTERHVHDNTVGAVLATLVGDDKVHTLDDTAVGSGTIMGVSRGSQTCVCFNVSMF